LFARKGLLQNDQTALMRSSMRPESPQELV
jgi:hypothetical protein